MKTLKYLLISFFSLIAILIIGWKIGVTIEYYHEISIGNEYAHNIITHLEGQKKLPDELDRDTLRQLNPDPKGEYLEARAARPMYKQTGSGSFTLAFIEGFDWPYLTYDSETKIWEMKY